MNDNSSSTDFNFSPTELNGIYLKLSENSTEEFESENEYMNMLHVLNKNFNEKLKNVDNTLLLNDLIY